MNCNVSSEVSSCPRAVARVEIFSRALSEYLGSRCNKPPREAPNTSPRQHPVHQSSVHLGKAHVHLGKARIELRYDRPHTLHIGAQIGPQLGEIGFCSEGALLFPKSVA